MLDKKERVFTWGFGAYGRLGHGDNKDEMVPRQLKFFDGPNRGAVRIAAGSTFSMAVQQKPVSRSYSELTYLIFSVVLLIIL